MLESERSPHSRFIESPLLSGVEEASRLAIFRALIPVTAATGFALLEQGKANDRLWFVLGGEVAIERTGPDGKADVLATLSGPAIYGTTTFFRGTALSATIRASNDLTVGTLDRRTHERLRRDDPRAAEELALSVVRVLSERFDMLDARLSSLMADHDADHPRATEWSSFRARLFEEPTL